MIQTIYSYICAPPHGGLRNASIAALCQAHEQHLARPRGTDRRWHLRGVVPIHERPDEALGQQAPGHWEGGSAKVQAMPAQREPSLGTRFPQRPPGQECGIAAKVEMCGFMPSLGAPIRSSSVAPNLVATATYLTIEWPAPQLRDRTARSALHPARA
jgi:hypothetical protein